MSKMGASIRYPDHVPIAERPEWEDYIVRLCVSRGRRRFPPPYPGIFDADDQMSRFMQGLFYGLCSVQWDRGDPIAYMVNKGLWVVRTYQYRAMGKRIIRRCATCGAVLKMSQKACHNVESNLQDNTVHKKDWRNTQRGKLYDPEESMNVIVQAVEMPTGIIEQMDITTPHDRHNGQGIAMSQFSV